MAWVALDRGDHARRDVRPRRAGRSLARAAAADPRRRLRARLRRASAAASCSPTARSELDASLLLMPTIGFPRRRRSARARHHRSDRARPAASTASCCATTRREPTTACRRAKGAFLACSFWLADAYVLLGRLDDARAAVRAAARAAQRRRAARRRSTTRAARRLVGNFPQAFSHVALINTAHNLARATKPAHQRSKGQPSKRTVSISPGASSAPVRMAQSRCIGMLRIAARESNTMKL